MLLLKDYEQEITSMLVASKRDMQQAILSQLSQKMFTTRLFAKIFEVAELLFKSGKEVNVSQFFCLYTPSVFLIHTIKKMYFFYRKVLSQI